ncbi:MAG: hypothetical protein U1E61_10550 [Bradyrhizobium sp.]
MNIFNTAAAAFLMLLSPGFAALAAAADAKIEWEIENRFRYFKRASDFREIAKIYKALKQTTPKPSALQLERALEKATVDGVFNGISGGDIRNGWAASVFLHTCGRGSHHDHASCKLENGDDYLNPQKANLILRLTNPADSPCEWKLDGVLVGTKPCAAEMTARDVSYDQPHVLSVSNPVQGTISTTIVLKDAFILSFGDSFSAGEGNPEQPVAFDPGSYSLYRDSSVTGGGERQYFPVREDISGLHAGDRHFFGDLAASWTNTQCHRSLYSQHTKAALHWALEHPHVSVTYASYSCTGAEVYEGILNAWWARDDVSDSFFDDAPQIVKALRDLCESPKAFNNTQWTHGDRTDSHFNSKAASIPQCTTLIAKKVSAILLSIGGNDVGFARMIANSSVDVPNAFSNARPWVYGLWRAASKPQDFDTGLRLARKNIPGRYQELSKVFITRLAVPPYRVILSAYPDVSTDEKGKTCRRANVGMDVHSIFGMRNPKASAEGANFVMKLRDIMKREGEDQGWRFADRHMTRGAPNSFAADADGIGHGLCAAGPASTPEGNMRFLRPDVPGSPPYTWRPSNPARWRSYSDRTRWLVTPNDAFLTTNYHDAYVENVDDIIQPLYAATLSGSFHPNALGHAALADSVLIELRKVLGAFED